MSAVRLFNKLSCSLYIDADLCILGAKSCIIGRQLRCFYKIANRWLQDIPETAQRLADYLRERREWVKEYILFGSYSEKCLPIQKALSWLQKGVVGDEHLETRGKVSICVTLKRLKLQSRYAQRQPMINLKELTGKLSSLLRQ